MALTYSVDPQGPYDGTVDTPVTVTAELSDGMKWGSMPAGWVKVDDVTATYASLLLGRRVPR